MENEKKELFNLLELFSRQFIYLDNFSFRSETDRLRCVGKIRFSVNSVEESSTVIYCGPATIREYPLKELKIY